MTIMEVSEVPVFVLCGGLGTRLREETEVRPKPMVPIGDKPILWHIMRNYSQHGFKKFVLCLGYKAEIIKSYFLNYSSLNSDFTVKLKTNATTFHGVGHDEDWEVTLTFTGEDAMTGSRVARAAAQYLGNAQHMAVTYGDGLTNADLHDELSFHLSHGRIGTVLGARLPSRFGELQVEGQTVTEFREKPEAVDSWVNGGYFLFHRRFLEYLSMEDSCVLEREPLVALAGDEQLCMYKHSGFWACMDTQRDREHLNGLWESGQAPWKVW